MTWGTFTTIMTVAGFASVLLFGPSWERKWLVTCFAAIAATGLIGLAIAVLLAEPVEPGTAGDGPPPARGVVEWVAVYHVDPIPEPTRTDFIDAAGFDVFHASVSCWTGLPSMLGVLPDRRVLGVWGQSEDKLRTAMDRVPGDPIVTAELRNVCPGD